MRPFPEKASHVMKFFSQKKYYVLAGVAFFFLIAFSHAAKVIGFTILLFLIGSFSTFYKRKLEDMGALGFELVTSTSLLAGIILGPLPGAAFGFLSSLLSITISRDVGITTIFFVATSAFVGAFARTLSNVAGVVWAGMLMLSLSMLLVQSFTLFMQQDNFYKLSSLIGILVNFVVNYFFLAYFSLPLMHLAS